MSSFLSLGLVVALAILLPVQSEGTGLREALCLDNMGPNGPSLEAFSEKGRELSLCVKEYRQRYHQEFACGRNLRDKTCVQIKDHFQSFIDDLRRCLTGPLTSTTSTTPSTLTTPTTSVFLPRDCQDVINNETVGDVQATIFPDGVNGVPVICTNGGLLFFSRRSVDSDFNRTYTEYENGFQTSTGDFWLGNKLLSDLVAFSDYKLLVNVTSILGDDVFAIYDTFSVAGDDDFYRLSIGDYDGNAGDAMTVLNNSPFSTSDTAEKSSLQTFAAIFGGGFWFLDNFIVNDALVTASGTSRSGFRWIDFPLQDATFTVIRK